MKGLPLKYTDILRKNCMGAKTPLEKNVDYWRDFLFYKTVELVFPFCLITLVPGVLYCMGRKLYFLAFLDLVALFLMLLVGFIKGPTIEQRKFLFIFTLYFIASYLLVYVGVFGPGMLFLYASCIFGLLILPKKYAYLWSPANLIIVLLFALLLEFDLSPMPLVNNFDTKEWLVIASNLIFLSLLSSVLIPKLFYGLSETFRSQRNLQRELDTQNKAQESLLKKYIQKNDDLEQFAYVVSHDLQEPLRMVTGFMAQLDKKYHHVLDSKAHQYIHFATDGAKRMQTIILDLLEYSKIGTMKGEKELVDMNQILHEYTLLRRQLIQKTEAALFMDDLPCIKGYRAPIVQIMHNLLDNAIKYSVMDKSPIIGIRALEQEHYWEFAVQDNGIGIDKEFQDRIFVLFQRLHNKYVNEGTGMGLAIAKRTVENLGGKIWVRSALDKGSTFHFTIPK